MVTEPISVRRIRPIARALAWVFLALVATGCHSEDPPPPNIIIVLADDLGYGDVSVYHPGNRIETPNLDRLAAAGMRFTDAHTPSAVCTPTRYGLLTGRYSWRSRLKSGVLTGKSTALIPASRTTIASLLAAEGYRTAFIGKWHLGWDWATKSPVDSSGAGWNPGDFANIDFAGPVTHTPNELGFDYAYGHCGSLDMAPYVYVENGRVTAVPDTVTVDTGEYSWWREGPTAPDFVHERVTPNFFERAIDFVRKESTTPEPFFLYLPLPSPHTPILPTAEWRGASGLNPYGDFTLMIDDYMGRLLATLAELQIADNTLVVFTSDNGCSPAAGFDEMVEMGHLPSSIYRGHKADIYEGGHRVPFLVRWPDRVPAGTVSDETVCLTDLLRTFADLTDHPLTDGEGEDSYSLLPVLTGKPLPTPLREATVHHSVNGSFAIRQGDWKLLMCPGSGGWSHPRPGEAAAADSLPPLQLYRLSTDPGETTNLVGSETARVRELRELLLRYIREGRSTPGTPGQRRHGEGMEAGRRSD